MSSACLNADGRKVLVGTVGSEIFELSNDEEAQGDMNQGPLVVGHCKDELWGLAVHPTQEEFCTVGDDKTLRVWGLKDHKMLRMLTLDDYARACCYSPNGHLIAVGMGGDVGRGKRPKDGTVVIVQTQKQSLDVVKELKNASEWISDIKFSPNGELLAVASHDNKVYVYDCLANFALKCACSGASSYIKHIDFTTDSTALQCSTGAYEILYFDANSGEIMHDGAEKFKDEPFASWTLAIGWPAQGVYPPFSDGTDVNAVARTGDGTLLATADDFGLVKLFRYPCASNGAPSKSFSGHAAHVTNVRVSHGDDYVLSTGGGDRASSSGSASAARRPAARRRGRASASGRGGRRAGAAGARRGRAPAGVATSDAAPAGTLAFVKPAPPPRPRRRPRPRRPPTAVARRGGAPSRAARRASAARRAARRRADAAFAHGVSRARVLGYNQHGGLVYGLGRTGVVYPRRSTRSASTRCTPRPSRRRRAVRPLRRRATRPRRSACGGDDGPT